MKKPNRKHEGLSVGDSTLTRRVLKRCRDAGIGFETETEFVKIGRNQFGTKTIGYMVPSDILKEERDRRAIELESKAKRVADERAERLAANRAQQIEEVTVDFPQLSAATIERLVDSGRSIFSSTDVGYQFKVGTKSYWNELGFSITGDPTGYLVRGKRLFDTYPARQLELKKTRLTVELLKSEWQKRYVSDELVLAQAIRFANRLQKVKRVADFYELKNRWMVANQENLTEGRVTRIETRSCWSCNGTGDYSLFSECYKCGGTGIYSSKTLYEHEFLIDGTRFRFHSYEAPKVVLAQVKDSCDEKMAFGSPFEKDELPVPNQLVIVQLIKQLMPTTEKPSCCTVREHSRKSETSGCFTLVS